MTQFYTVPYHEVDLNDVALSKTLADALEEHYPGWGWMVRVFSEPNGGVIEIKSQWIQAHMIRPAGHIIKYDDVVETYNVTKKAAIMAGGEMLERCRLPRSRFNNQDVREIDGINNKYLYSTYSEMIV